MITSNNIKLETNQKSTEIPNTKDLEKELTEVNPFFKLPFPNQAMIRKQLSPFQFVPYSTYLLVRKHEEPDHAMKLALSIKLFSYRSDDNRFRQNN